MLKTGQLQKIEKLVVNIFSFEFNVMHMQWTKPRILWGKFFHFWERKSGDCIIHWLVQGIHDWKINKSTICSIVLWSWSPAVKWDPVRSPERLSCGRWQGRSQRGEGDQAGASLATVSLAAQPFPSAHLTHLFPTFKKYFSEFEKYFSSFSSSSILYLDLGFQKWPPVPPSLP